MIVVTVLIVVVVMTVVIINLHSTHYSAHNRSRMSSRSWASRNVPTPMWATVCCEVSVEARSVVLL